MKNLILSVANVIENIKQKKHFEAILPDGSLKIKIEKYVPYCCTATHSGSRLREELKKKILLNDFQRWYEEDPFTNSFIESMPITIVANDSRFEYDLNRKPEDCIYTYAWGNKVWETNLTEQEIETSRQKHAGYYQILHALVTVLEEMFKECIVYDIHSYNYKRIDRDTPVFNIGTENINMLKYNEVVEDWLKQLNAIELPELNVYAAQNDVFYGRGYNLEYINNHFENTLVLATEIKKVYCDELTGNEYPHIINKLKHSFMNAIIKNIEYFESRTKVEPQIKINKLSDKSISREMSETD